MEIEPPDGAEAAPFALTPGTVPGFPDLREGRSDARLLHRLDGTMTWAAPTLPPALAGVGSAFDVHVTPLANPRGADRVLGVYRARLPFALGGTGTVFRPEGMLVTLDGALVPFSRVPAPRARRTTWRLQGRDLVLTHASDPGKVTIGYPGVTDALAAHDPAKAAGDLMAYARGDLTLRGHTRTGLRLPAPATAEWTLTLPEGSARFASHVALEAPPVPGMRSDGASVVLSVIADGDPVEVARIVVAREGHFSVFRADLSKYAGQRVTLRLVTEPGLDAAFDWVFVGSPTVWGPPTGEVRRVVVIGIDTTRPDHLSFFGYDRPTTPELDEALGSAVVFDRTWSVSPRTRPAFRTATTGLRPLEAVGAPSIGQTLSRHGFATGGFVANIHLQPRFGFSDGFDHWWFDGKANADQQVDRALDWLTAHEDRDAFLFLHLMDPHLRYDAPEPYRDRFVQAPDPEMPDRVTRGMVYQWMRSGQLTRRRKEHLVGLHDGELAFTSAELGRFFARLDAMPGRTLVVVHTDHGEEFWEHDGFEHNHTLYDEVTRALLAFRPGGGMTEGLRSDVPASLVDLAPTLYDLLGIEDGPRMHGRSLVPLMQGEQPGPLATRGLPVAHVQYRKERWGVVTQGFKYALYTGSGDEELFDLVRDPGERTNLASRVDLTPFRAHLREAHEIAVGPGLRIELHNAPAFTVQLPTAPEVAQVLDPETLIDHRANIEWGELPARLAADVGSLAVDGANLIFAPGRDPNGVLVVLFDDGVTIDPAATTLVVDGTSQAGPQWRQRDRRIALVPGPVLIPPSTEAARMGIGPGAAGSAGEAKMLCELGYIQCDPPAATP